MRLRYIKLITDTQEPDPQLKNFPEYLTNTVEQSRIGKY